VDRGFGGEDGGVVRSPLMTNRPSARSFLDLDVYKLLYDTALKIVREVIPQLPKSEKFDLADQMNRACKAPPALISEGYAKKHQKRAFGKYLEDAIGECNEMITHLSFAKDLGYIDSKLCDELIKTYDIGGKQLYNLAKSWSKQPIRIPKT
jgi:four helix bundle protein